MSDQKKLRVLIVEDSEFDARILVNLLRQGGYEITFQRVETAETLQAALKDKPWDVVLADYNLPTFNALDALRQHVLDHTAHNHSKIRHGGRHFRAIIAYRWGS